MDGITGVTTIHTNKWISTSQPTSIYLEDAVKRKCVQRSYVQVLVRGIRFSDCIHAVSLPNKLHSEKPPNISSNHDALPHAMNKINADSTVYYQEQHPPARAPKAGSVLSKT